MFSALSPQLSTLQLPLRIELPDIQPMEFAPEPEVTVRVLDATLLDGSAEPTLDQLAEAYVDRRIEIDGPIMQVIEIADRISQVFRAVSNRPAVARPRSQHARELDAEAISYHYDLSNDFYRLWLDPEMVYPAPISKPAANRWRQRRSPSCATSVASCACSPTTTCWTSAAAGAASRGWRRANSA